MIQTFPPIVLQVCLTPDMSALLVAESQKCEGKDQRHRLVFLTTSEDQKESLKVCARLFIDSPVSAICHIPVTVGVVV